MKGRRAVAWVAVVLGAAMALGAAGFRAPGAAPGAGPAVFPLLVAIGLAASGLMLAAETRRERREAPLADAVAARAFELPAVALVAAGLAGFVLLVRPAGFTLAATVMFVLVSRGFGSARLWRSAAIGFALSLVVYLAFTEGLGLRLPAGPLVGALLPGR